jgi:hypothetical protein
VIISNDYSAFLGANNMQFDKRIFDIWVFARYWSLLLSAIWDYGVAYVLLHLCRDRAYKGQELRTPPLLANGLRCSPEQAALMQQELDSIDRYLSFSFLVAVCLAASLY